MHNVIKSRSLSCVDATNTYSFPDIFKETGMTDDANSKASGSSFQRIYVDVDSGQTKESADANFIKSGLFSNTDGNTDTEQIDYQKIIDEMILESRQKEAEAYQNGIQDGHKDGFQQGRKAGVAEGLKEIETILHSLQQAMMDIKQFRKELSLRAERETVSLSLAIAGKILLQEPEMNPRIIAGVVKKTFETIAINAPVRIRINPAELSYMRERRHLIPIEGEVTFIEDSSVSCGGCVVESLSGDIDARIESQLKVVEEAFLPALKKNAEDLEGIS